MENSVIASLTPEWLSPIEHKPPAGCSVNLLTTGGIEVDGLWTNDGRYLAWSPKLKTPSWLKEKISEAYLKNGLRTSYP